MPTDLRKEKTLDNRPRLKATCIKLHEMALDLGAEARLPTMAELREEFAVSTYTLNDAIRELERRQVLRSVNGVGIFVTARQRPLTGNIGIIGGEGFHRPQMAFHHRLMHGLEKVVIRNKQHLMFLGDEKNWDVRACEKVDGILVVGVDNAEQMVHHIPSGTPTVTIFTGTENTSSVTVDDYQGGKLAVEYLLQNNHQRIACLMEKLPALSKLRLAGYKSALIENGIKLKSEWVRLTSSVDITKSDQPYITWGRQQMQKWLRGGWQKTGCTAIFVQNEMAAIGVIQLLQEEGINVPQQVSVIGFDGTELCNVVSPSLCAVQVPLTEIGAKAVEILNQQINDASSEIQSIVLPLDMRKGGSVATAP